MTEGWTGLRSRKFKGSIKITAHPRADTDFLSAEFLYGPQPIGGKRHFRPSLGPALVWKPSVRKVLSVPRRDNPPKLTDFPCQLTPKSFLRPLRVMRSLGTFSGKKSEDVSEVRNLELWEQRTLDAKARRERLNRYKVLSPLYIVDK